MKRRRSAPARSVFVVAAGVAFTFGTMVAVGGAPAHGQGDSGEGGSPASGGGVPSAPQAGSDQAGSDQASDQAGSDQASDDNSSSANDSAGYTPANAAAGTAALNVNGYIDVGFANASGNGSSFAANDTRVPADYGVDAFAPAVNSRGDVASTDSGGRFVNGFLPRSVGIGGRPSFLLNTLDVDLRYHSDARSPLTIFSRFQLLPRFVGDGTTTRVLVEQAFGRVTPFDLLDLAVSLGKFDSVFGVEYLDNQANIRTGVTPSLASRYTTGPSVGAKIFYRQQIGPLWSALSINAAATNSGTMVESLQPSEISFAGEPVLSARLGYEFNHRVLQMKLGASGLRGPRNDQRDPDARQRMWGVDGRLFVAGIAVAGEYVHVDEDEGRGPKTTALGSFPLVSEFHARTSWVQVSYALFTAAGPLQKVTPYCRYDFRHAWFEGFTPISVDRITAGMRVDLWDAVMVKGEALVNRERAGAPDVSNNVYTSSVVYQW